VTPAVRENRLWQRISPSSNGLGWTLGGQQALHSGSQLGSNTYIRIYRDKGLVIAIMSNRDSQGNNAGGLGTLSATLGSKVLAP
jgi:hypothetical protein